jgi:hypothetical protein
MRNENCGWTTGKFYIEIDDGSLVLVDLIGEKRGNKLFVEGEEFEL